MYILFLKIARTRAKQTVFSSEMKTEAQET